MALKKVLVAVLVISLLTVVFVRPQADTEDVFQIVL